MLQASSIHFCIQNRPIVNQASLNLEPGEILAVLGPNGAGKSTLFKILSGDTSCKHGHVSYNGTAIQGLKPAQLAEIRAVMPQHSSVNFPFSAQEVVELGLTTIKPKNPALILNEVMELTQTKHLAKQAFHSLSGGEKQRVQLARVLVQIWEQKPFPRYLLLDEPTSSLDIAQQHGVLGILRKLKARNIGVLIILHELNLAAQYADRIALLKKGNLAACASVPEVMQEQLLSEVFDYPVEVFPHPHQNHWMVSTSSSNYSSMKTQKLA